MTRRLVTTKYVIVHWKYLSTSQPAHTITRADASHPAYLRDVVVVDVEHEEER